MLRRAACLLLVLFTAAWAQDARPLTVTHFELLDESLPANGGVRVDYYVVRIVLHNETDQELKDIQLNLTGNDKVLDQYGPVRLKPHGKEMYFWYLSLAKWLGLRHHAKLQVVRHGATIGNATEGLHDDKWVRTIPLPNPPGYAPPSDGTADTPTYTPDEAPSGYPPGSELPTGSPSP